MAVASTIKRVFTSPGLVLRHFSLLALNVVLTSQNIILDYRRRIQTVKRYQISFIIFSKFKVFIIFDKYSLAWQTNWQVESSDLQPVDN